MKKLKQYRVPLIILGVLVVVALTVLTVFAVLGNQAAQQPKSVVGKAMDSSQLFKTTQALKPTSDALYTSALPASAPWWGFATRFAPQWTLPTWQGLTVKPVALGATIYGTQEGMSGFSNYFGTPTIMLQYNSVAQANQAEKQFVDPSVTGNTYTGFQKNNIIILLPTYIYSNVLFKHSRDTIAQDITKVTPGELTTNKGTWRIYWANLDTYVRQTAKDPSDYTVYANALHALGYNANANGVWNGISTDGIHWQGQNVGTGNTQVWGTGDYTKFASVLNATAVTVDKNGTTKSGRPTKGDDPNYTQYTTFFPNQSLLLQYFAAITTKNAQGDLTDPATGAVYKSKPLPASQKGITRYTFSPSAWYGLVRDPAAQAFYKTFNINYWTFDIEANNAFNITLA